MHRTIHIVLSVFFVLISVQTAFADPVPEEVDPETIEVPPEPVDPCLTLIDNQEWNGEFAVLTENVKRHDYDAALLNGQKLSQICERSPILNYSIGRIYQEKGDEAKALEYLKRATMFSREFNVSDSNLEKMWYDQYEAEHPDARPANIEARKKENEKLHADVEAANARIQNMTDGLHQMETESHNNYGVGLWTGVGMAGAGVVLAAVGGALMAKDDKAIEYEDVLDDVGNIKEEFKNDKHPKGNVATSHYVYAGMLFAGAGLAIAGGIVAGIMGYKYTHSENVSESLSFGIAPNGASVHFSF